MNVPVARLVLLVAALTAAGAGCDDGAIELGRDDSARGPESTFLILPEEGEGGAVPGPSPGGGGAGGAPTPGEGSPSGDDGSTPPITDGGTTSTTRSDGGLAVDDRAGVGTMGRAFLRGDVTDVVVEVDMTPGESLTNQSRSAVLEQIEDRGNKTSVGFVTGSTLPEQSVYTTDQLRSLMEAHRSAWSTDERLAVYVMVLSGQHQDGTTVGVAFNASAFAVFPDQLAGGLLGLNYRTTRRGRWSTSWATCSGS